MPELPFKYEYPRHAVAVDLIVVRSDSDELREILLIERGREPFKGSWALPGGFLEEHETLEEGAARELKEETGVAVGLDQLFQLKAYSQPNRDPRTRVISVVFLAKVQEGTKAAADDDAADAKWFQLDDLPALAFDHSTIIADWRR